MLDLKQADSMDRCLIMGALNVTPDSFSDGGQFTSVASALTQARRMIEEGADIVDVGGESSRPGAAPVAEQIELDRVIPVVEAIRAECDVSISIDTSKSRVMRESVAAGADMINDISALGAVGSLEAATELEVPLCLMHMQGRPADMQKAPVYRDVVADVTAFLAERAQACERAGVARKNIIVDPGFGFGKTLEHNLELLRNLEQICGLGYPVLVGVSRKSIIGHMLGRPVDQRLSGGLALAVIARQKGAAIIRTHDVAPTVDALKILQCVGLE